MSDCRVLLVDDHAVFRETLAFGLTRTPDIAVVGQAGSTTEALRILGDVDVDVVVLDLSLPGRGGPDLISQILRRHDEVGVLILSARPPDQLIVRLIGEGASGYLHKSCSFDDLTAAIRRINSGQSVLSGKLEELLDRSLEEGELQPHEMLSNREYQVMERLVAGAGVSDIAREMNLSVKTISTYRKRLLEKLGLHSNSEVVGYAIRHGIVDP